MTREETIKILKSKMDGHTDTSYEWAETVRMAIKALEQEPKILNKIRAEIEHIGKATPLIGTNTVIEIIDKYKTESENKI